MSFSPIHYSAMKCNGASLSTLSPTEVGMFDGKVLQVATSSINAAGTFTTTFKHA